MGRALPLATRIIYWSIKGVHKDHLYGSSVFFSKTLHSLKKKKTQNSYKKYAYMKQVKKEVST